MENHLWTGFERRTLWKMANRLTYYSKMIAWSRQLFQETDIARESVYSRTICGKLTLNLIVIFNSFTDLYFLKYVTKIFCLLLFSGKIWECFKVQLSVVVFILPSTEANQLQVLYVRTLGNIQRKFITKTAVLKSILSNLSGNLERF